MTPVFLSIVDKYLKQYIIYNTKFVLSLTLGLNPSFSANPPYPAFPFSPSGFTIWISQTVYCYF